MSAWIPVVTLRSRGDEWSWGWKPPTDAPLAAPSAYVGVGYSTRDEAWRAAVADLRSRGWDGVVVGHTEERCPNCDTPITEWKRWGMFGEVCEDCEMGEPKASA